MSVDKSRFGTHSVIIHNDIFKMVNPSKWQNPKNTRCFQKDLDVPRWYISILHVRSYRLYFLKVYRFILWQTVNSNNNNKNLQVRMTGGHELTVVTKARSSESNNVRNKDVTFVDNFCRLWRHINWLRCQDKVAINKNEVFGGGNLKTIGPSTFQFRGYLFCKFILSEQLTFNNKENLCMFNHIYNF